MSRCDERLKARVEESICVLKNLQILTGERDVLHGVSGLYKTRVKYVTLVDDP